VAARSFPQPGLGNRWASAGAALAWAIAGGGWLTEVAQRGSTPDDGPHQLAWQLQEQGAGGGPIGGPFHAGWGYPTGLLLMGLLLATFTAAAMANRTR
jgi:hypothetical protein